MSKNILTQLANQEVVVFNTANRKCYIGEGNQALKVLKDLPKLSRLVDSLFIECTTLTSEHTFMVKVYDVSDIESLLRFHRERFLENYYSKESNDVAILARQIEIVKALMHNASISSEVYRENEDSLRVFFDQPVYTRSDQKRSLQDAINTKVNAILSQSILSQKSISSRLYMLLHKAFGVDSHTLLGGDVIDIAVNYVKDLDPQLIENYKLK